MSDAAKAIEADRTIDGIDVLHGPNRTPLIELKREQLDYLKQDDNAPTIAPTFRNKDIKKAHLVVRSPDLLGDSMWSFNYKRHKIDGGIQDTEFVKAVRNGEKSFAAGTLLVGDLIIREEFDAAQNKYFPVKYSITKVHHLEHQKQFPVVYESEKNEGAERSRKPKSKRGPKKRKK